MPQSLGGFEKHRQWLLVLRVLYLLRAWIAERMSVASVRRLPQAPEKEKHTNPHLTGE